MSRSASVGAVFFRHELAGPAEVWFTDRQGGTSAGPFASLDLGTRDHRGDHASVRGNLAAVQRGIGADRLALMNQVHGTEVAWAADSGPIPTADALVTDRPGTALVVRVADCVPVVLLAPHERLVAVAHAGRPGLVAGVVPRVMEALRSAGATTVRGWVGPRICGGCYELPAELAAEVARVAPAAAATTSWGTPAADIGAGVVEQLTARGVEVDDVAGCTREDPERFFSYRRQGPDSGRLAGIVMLR